MKQKAGTLHRVLNIILAIFYVPYSFICMTLFMATEVSLRETNQIVIFAYNIVAHVGILMPIFAYAMLYLSHRMYNNGRKQASYLVRFLPIIVMVITIALAAAVEALVK